MSTGTIQKAEKPTPAEAALAWMMGQVEKRGARLENLLHPDMPLERFTESCRLAFARNPDLTDLGKTDGASLMQALMLGARSGLDVHGHYGHLVSFQKKKFVEAGRDVWKTVIVFMPDWKGMLATLKAAGTVVDADPMLVYEADDFTVLGGAEADIHHVPFIRRKPADVKGAIIAAYTRFLLPGGQWVCKGLMLLEDIERIESGIKSDKGPWGGAHRGEMIKKSSFRQAWKWLGPATSDRAVAIRIAALEEAEAIEGDFTVTQAPAPATGVAAAKEKARAQLVAKGAWAEDPSRMVQASATQAAVMASLENGEPGDDERSAILKAELESSGGVINGACPVLTT